MSCLPCFQSRKTNEPPVQDKPVPVVCPASPPSSPSHFGILSFFPPLYDCVLFLTHDLLWNAYFFLYVIENNYKAPCENGNNNKPADQTGPPIENGDSSNLRTFTFRELASATKNFRQECLIGEGGFGKVFKGTLQGGEVTNFHETSSLSITFVFCHHLIYLNK